MPRSVNHVASRARRKKNFRSYQRLFWLQEKNDMDSSKKTLGKKV